jgi:hypothetical protein
MQVPFTATLWDVDPTLLLIILPLLAPVIEGLKRTKIVVLAIEPDTGTSVMLRLYPCVYVRETSNPLFAVTNKFEVSVFPDTIYLCEVEL